MGYDSNNSKQENPTNNTETSIKEEDIAFKSSIPRELKYIFGQSLGRIIEEQASKIKLIEVKVKSPMRKHFGGEEVEGVWIPHFGIM